MGTGILPLTFPVMAICGSFDLIYSASLDLASTPVVNINARFTGHLMVQTFVHDELDYPEGCWTAADFNAFQLLPVWREI